ncbi:MAG: phage Gp37/Gp68 family protein [Pseudomonadota bacterium]
MAETSAIEWTDATFNPWVGCTKISPACDNCYAETWADRFGEKVWGNNPRRRTSEQNWNQPRKWNRDADKWQLEHGRPRFVFCASLADVFDNQVPEEWRDDLWALIKECDQLIWLLLTKRPQNISKMLPQDWGDGYSNVWLGTTVENQDVTNRNVPELVAIPAVKRFLSIEPMLGPIDLKQVWVDDHEWMDVLHGHAEACDIVDGWEACEWAPMPIDWVIAGGESGKDARPADPDWYRTLRDDCFMASVPFHFKQWGEWIPISISPDKDHIGFDRTQDPRLYIPVPRDVQTSMIGEGQAVARIGKKNAGRLLDGKTWDERPTP